MKVSTIKFPMEAAPRNGMTVIVGDPDVGEYPMHWEATAENGLFPGRLGFWVSLDRSFTWNEHDGAGPTYWRAIQQEPAATEQRHG